MTDQPNLIDGVAEFDATVHTALGQFVSSTVKVRLQLAWVRATLRTSGCMFAKLRARGQWAYEV